MRSFTGYLRLIGVLTPEDLGQLTKEWYNETAPRGPLPWPTKVRTFDALVRQRYPDEHLQYITYVRLLGQDTKHKE